MTKKQPGPRYRAHFQPEAWQNDYAVDVDDEGEDEWDCTKFVTNPPEWCVHYFTPAHNVGRELADRGKAIDNDDVLQTDPAAPAWVRKWRGPFTITIRREGPSEDD